MFSRQQYLNRECTHDEYYAQMVTPAIKNAVAARFRIERLYAGRDNHFNNIHLSRCDSIFIPRRISLPPGESFTSAVAVCILKEAARQLVVEYMEKNAT